MRIVWLALFVFGFIKLCLEHPPAYIWLTVIVVCSFVLLTRK